jgi:rhodanese-related sulfurtransferase
MPRAIGLEQVGRLVDDGAQLVEVLPAAEYDEEHLPGAVDSRSRSSTRRAPSDWTARAP